MSDETQPPPVPSDLAQPRHRSAHEIEVEVRWEVEAVERGAERYRRAAVSKSPGELPGGAALLRAVMGSLTPTIRDAQAEALAALGGKGGSAEGREVSAILVSVGAEQLALMALLTALTVPDTEGRPLTALALALSRDIRRQIEFDRWEDQQEGAAPDARCDAYLRRLDAQDSPKLRALWERWRKRVLIDPLSPWPRHVAIATGTAPLMLLTHVAPERFALKPGTQSSPHMLCLTERAVDEIRAREVRAEVSRPLLMPMIVPPNDWRYAP